MILGAIPIDFTAAGTEIAGYVATAAGAGVGIFVAVMAVKVVIKVFSSVGKKG